MKTKKLDWDTASLEEIHREIDASMERDKKEKADAYEKAFYAMERKVVEAKIVASSITAIPIEDMTPFLMIGDGDDKAVFTIVDKKNGIAFLAKVAGDEETTALYIFGKLQEADKYLTALWTPEWDVGKPQQGIDDYA